MTNYSWLKELGKFSANDYNQLNKNKISLVHIQTRSLWVPPSTAHNESLGNTEAAQWSIPSEFKLQQKQIPWAQKGKDLMRSYAAKVKNRNVLERQHGRQGRPAATKKQFVLHETH